MYQKKGQSEDEARKEHRVRQRVRRAKKREYLEQLEREVAELKKKGRR